jgi:pimeloyl-ACP methyl ester carboxylesterase
LKAFSKDYHVVAIDMRGYGDTDKPPNKLDYRIELLVQDIAELIPALGHSSCVLCAHDWGGGVAWFTVHINTFLLYTFSCLVMCSPGLLL